MLSKKGLYGKHKQRYEHDFLDNTLVEAQNQKKKIKFKGPSLGRGILRTVCWTFAVGELKLLPFGRSMS